MLSNSFFVFSITPKKICHFFVIALCKSGRRSCVGTEAASGAAWLVGWCGSDAGIRRIDVRQSDAHP